MAPFGQPWVFGGGGGISHMQLASRLRQRSQRCGSEWIAGCAESSWSSALDTKKEAVFVEGFVFLFFLIVLFFFFFFCGEAKRKPILGRSNGGLDMSEQAGLQPHYSSLLGHATLELRTITMLLVVHGSLVGTLGATKFPNAQLNHWNQIIVRCSHHAWTCFR